MSYPSAEAKKLFFLTAEDLHSLPRETLYGGFGTGRAAYYFDESDLEAAAIAKHGKEGYAKKLAARQKREDNKRKRAEAAVAAEKAEMEANPALARKKQRQEAKAKEIAERNVKIAGKPWDLTILTPERVAGTKASLEIKDFPPDGWPGDSTISCFESGSPAYSFGNIHGFKGKSNESDKDMVFETKWKVMGKRHTGTLTVRVVPSDKKETEKDMDENEQAEESLMVVGKFDSGVNDGVRRWSFKGYR